MAVALSLPDPCDVEDCERLSWKAGLCQRHRVDPKFRMPGRVCDRPGCDRPHSAKGLCGTHYKARWMRLNRAVSANPDRRPKSIRQLRADLDASAAIADAQLWMDEVWSAALFGLDA